MKRLAFNLNGRVCAGSCASARSELDEQAHPFPASGTDVDAAEPLPGRAEADPGAIAFSESVRARASPAVSYRASINENGEVDVLRRADLILDAEPDGASYGMGLAIMRRVRAIAWGCVGLLLLWQREHRARKAIASIASAPSGVES